MAPLKTAVASWAPLVKYCIITTVTTFTPDDTRQIKQLKKECRYTHTRSGQAHRDLRKAYKRFSPFGKGSAFIHLRQFVCSRALCINCINNNNNFFQTLFDFPRKA